MEDQLMMMKDNMIKISRQLDIASSQRRGSHHHHHHHHHHQQQQQQQQAPFANNINDNLDAGITDLAHILGGPTELQQSLLDVDVKLFATNAFPIHGELTSNSGPLHVPDSHN